MERREFLAATAAAPLAGVGGTMDPPKKNWQPPGCQLFTEGLRTVETVDADGLYPRFSSNPIRRIEEQDQRTQAVVHVLCNMPDESYAAIKERRAEFCWSIPSRRISGMTLHAHCVVIGDIQEKAAAKVIFLSPVIENGRWDRAIGIVAHQLAYMLCARGNYKTVAEHDRNYLEAVALTERWGLSHDPGREALRISRLEAERAIEMLNVQSS